MKTEQSRAPARGWVKKALCAGVIMGLSMTAGMSFAGHEPKDDNGNTMTPYARIAKIQVVKDEYGTIDREATYNKAAAVALDIATYIATVNDTAASGFPADWIVGGHEGGGTIESSIMQIPSPNPIDPDNPDLGIKKANVMDLCNSYYAKQALGVAPISGTSKKVVNGYSHAPALPCELSTWNDDENIYVDMLDPNAIFSIFFTDVLVSADMQDPDFATAITALPVAVKSEIKTVVYKALDEAGYNYNTLDKMLGPKYKTVEEIFEVVAVSPNVSPFKHVAYTKSDGTAFGPGETSAVAQAIINAMSIHGEPGAGTHDPALESILSPGSKWRSARHLPLGLPGKPEKNWVIEACSPTYAKMAMGTGMHHATALPCEIAVQRVDRDGDDSTESLVISYLDPAFMFGAMFSDMTDEEKAALGNVPGYISSDLGNIVQFALDNGATALNGGVQFYNTMLP
ncbi:MAG: DUF302 domain-containing protein [Pseudomonadota bacterium]